MLSVMREHAGNWLIKVVLFIIVIVFVFWGVGSFSSKDGAVVAWVNDEPITSIEYDNSYKNIIQRLKQQFGNNLNENIIQMFQVKRQALNNLIEQKLLLNEANKLGFQVNPDELAANIMNIKAFQNENGVFDDNIYKKLLAHNKMTPDEFETDQKNQMLTNMVVSFITDFIKVSNIEARQWYKWENAAVDINWALFTPKNYKNLKPRKKEIKSYYEKHKAQYMTESMVNIKYIKFVPKDFQSKIKISDQQLKEYYEENLDKYQKPKTVQASHILVKADKNADANTVKKTKKKALEIYEKAKQNKDFAKLAQKYSEGPSKNNGGSIGEFKKEEMVKPFADKAFSMKPNEISEPIRTRFGWHIIKVEKVNEEKTPNFVDIKSKIKKKLEGEEAKDIAYDEAESAYELTYDKSNIKDIANDFDVKLHELDSINYNSTIKEIPNSKQFIKAIINLNENEYSEILDFGNDGYYILQVSKKIPSKVKPFEKVKKLVLKDLIKEKQDDLAKTNAEKLLKALNKGADMNKECKKYDLKVRSTGYFKRNGEIAVIGRNKSINDASFTLSKNNPYFKDVIKTDKGYYVIGFKSEKLAKINNFENQKEKIKKTILNDKKRSVFSDWIAQIKEKSNIKIKENFLN